MNNPITKIFFRKDYLEIKKGDNNNPEYIFKVMQEKGMDVLSISDGIDDFHTE